MRAKEQVLCRALQAALADADNGLTAEQIAAITPYASAYDPSKEY